MKRKIITRDQEFYRNLIALAIPIAIQGIISFSVNFADNIMIGRLGDIAVSGVYMGNQFQTILMLFTGGVDSAMLIIAAQYWGIKDTLSVKKIAAMGIRMSVIVGLVLTVLIELLPRQFISLFTDDAEVIEAAAEYVRIVALSYIFFCASQLMVSAQRSVENAKLGMYISLMALLTNVGLNYVLIFGKLGFPALGIKGAAIATLIARIIECAVVYFYAFRVDKKLRMKPSDMLLSEPTLRKDFIKNGTPVVMGQLVWAANMLTYSGVMGHMAASAVTAASIVGQMENLLRVFAFGLSAALGIITSKTVGSGQFEKMKEYATTAEIIFLGVGLVSAVLIQLLKHPFISLYDVSSDAVNYYMTFMNILTFTYIGTCWQATCLGGLVKSGGDTSFVFKNDTIFVFLVVIPSSIIALVSGAPAWVVFLCLKCDQLLKCIVAYFKINSFNWMKKLTREDLGKEAEA
ncbi:MAG: MATE family efflux transporter [Lachnospiraceae bacterium]|nr:MATE family efflux transporter [Lachnospiraceae bacterium]